MPQLARLMRYPVKGLPGEDLDHAMLAAGEGIANDRRFALTRSVSSTMDGAWMACQSFFINARQDGLLRFRQRLDEPANMLHLTSPEGSVLSIDLTDPDAIAQANRQLPMFLWSLETEDANPFPPMLAERRREAGSLSGYWDFTDSAISLINLASVREIEAAAGVTIDPCRFRGNLLIEGLEPWEELLPGRSLQIGGAELEGIRPAHAARQPRSPTAARDPDVPAIMTKAFGHNYCGIYLRVVKPGTIQPGDRVRISGNAGLPLEQAASHGAPDHRLWPKFARIISRDSNTATLTNDGPPPLPQARPGQRLRLHGMKAGEAEITASTDGTITIGQANAELPDRLLVSGPFRGPDSAVLARFQSAAGNPMGVSLYSLPSSVSEVTSATTPPDTRQRQRALSGPTPTMTSVFAWGKTRRQGDHITIVRLNGYCTLASTFVSLTTGSQRTVALGSSNRSRLRTSCQQQGPVRPLRYCFLILNS
ncbi:MAG: MOSC domain-containing protein [Nitratireductor sp.]